ASTRATNDGSFASSSRRAGSTSWSSATGLWWETSHRRGSISAQSAVASASQLHHRFQARASRHVREGGSIMGLQPVDPIRVSCGPGRSGGRDYLVPRVQWCAKSTRDGVEPYSFVTTNAPPARAGRAAAQEAEYRCARGFATASVSGG